VAALSDLASVEERYLAGMSHAAATVSVVTTDGPAGRFGVTVSAMASVSLEGPILLVCLHQMSAAARAIRENGAFCVNLLRHDQSPIADTFAGRVKTKDGDKFSCATWTKMKTGAPRLADPLVAFDCRLIRNDLVGTHYVCFGEVAEIFLSAGAPLIYRLKSYGTASRIEAERMEASS
jgi:flavin reductase (DIM6/NTAB) family NADH-FMN oxidoreductase RutF